MTLESLVDQVCVHVTGVLDGRCAEEYTEVIIGRPISDFSAESTDLLRIVSDHELDYRIDDGGELAEKFNSDLNERTSDFILCMGFRKAVGEVFKAYVDKQKNVQPDEIVNTTSKTNNENEGEPRVQFHNFMLSLNTVKLLNKLALLLDYQIALIQTGKVGIGMKSGYFQVLAFVTNSTFMVSPALSESFWYYLETREKDLKTNFFDKNLTSDRIAILEICNNITDKYYSDKDTDTYSKDTYNDKFYARVRVFLANMLNLEDNTGLNKYFNCAKTVSKEPVFKDSFLRDIAQINKLFRDPYYYLKRENHKLLGRMVDTMQKVSNYLIKEEGKYQEKYPVKDPFAILERQKEYVNAENGTDKLYFQEDYFVSAFDPVKRGEKYEKLKVEDEIFFNNQFDESKMRQIYIVQIFMITSFLYELLPRFKKNFLAQFPSGAKHFVDDATPDILSTPLTTIKRDIMASFRRTNVSYSHLIQHLFTTEMYWWSWLIYGKDSNGKPLFADKTLLPSAIEKVSEKNKSILPYKDKKYFNTYATPQLSRKMRTMTGLDKLQTKEDGLDQVAKDLDSKLQQSSEPSEQRNSIFWKFLRSVRWKKWLEFPTLIKPTDITTECKPHDSEDMELEVPAPETIMNSPNDATIDKSDIESVSVQSKSAPVTENSKKRPLPQDEEKDADDNANTNEPEIKKTKL